MRSAHAGGEHQATLPFVAALWGAVSVAYAAAFGGEPHPPGVLVGIYLGAQGALVGACTWGVWWGWPPRPRPRPEHGGRSPTRSAVRCAKASATTASTLHAH